MGASLKRTVLVKSCRRFGKRRAACEITWVRALRAAGISVRFILGEGGNETIGDTQITTTGGDCYKSNITKLCHALCLLLNVEDFDRVFICDDDTFVHPERWLAHDSPDEMEGRIYLPKPGQEELSNGLSWVHGGSGWYMSHEIARHYIAGARKVGSYDDLLASQIALRAGFTITSRPDLYGADHYRGANDIVGPDNSFMTCHPVQPDRMVKLHEETRGISPVHNVLR